MRTSQGTFNIKKNIKRNIKLSSKLNNWRATTALLAGLFLFNTQAAQAGEFEDYYTVGEVTVENIGETPLEDVKALEYLSDCSHLEDPNQLFDPNGIGGVVAATKIINLGKQLWKIVEDGKPTVEVRTASANALPRGIKCWDELENWSFPKAPTFQVVYKNLLGMEVVNFSFQIVYTSGGTYQGKGAYITNIAVLPKQVDVLWGFNFSADVNIPSVINLRTRDNPMAGAEIMVNWRVTNTFKDSQRTIDFFVKGDGELIAL